MSHLTVEQRYTIAQMLQNGYQQKDIAKIIGKSKSVVSREIARNVDKRNGKYRFELAKRKHENRQKQKFKHTRFTEDIRFFVEELLWCKYSPEQIVGKAKELSIEMVSHERIYKHIWDDKKRGGLLHEHLRTGGKRYRKRGSSRDKRGIISNRISIDNRPLIVEERKRIGDLEIDTIIGKNHKGAIVTINDRASGKLKMKKLKGKNASELAKIVTATLQEWKPYLKTITSDNGKEFAEHKIISEALGINFYFAHPYHSWERGSNENLNGLIRQYIPKKTNFDELTDEYINFVENELNNRPRKRFNFETPNNIFNQLKNQDAVAFMT